MHSDHIRTDDLRAFNFVHQERIGCYGGCHPRPPPDRVRVGPLSPGFLTMEGGQVAQLDPIEIVPGVAISVQGVSIMPFRLWHGRLAVLGYRIGELAYATDCNRIPKKPRAPSWRSLSHSRWTSGGATPHPLSFCRRD